MKPPSTQWLSHPLLTAIEDPLEEWLDRMQVCRLSGGEVLAHRGEPALTYDLLVEGILRLTQESKGAAKLARLLSAPSTVADAEVLQDVRLLTDVTAVTESTIVRIPRTLFLQLIQTSPGFALAHAKALSTHLCLAAHAELESFASLDQRLASLLLAYTEAFSLRGGHRHITLPVTTAELARNLGVTRRGLIPAISRWREKGVISRTEHGELLIRDQARLADAAATIFGARHVRLGHLPASLGRPFEEKVPVLEVLEAPDGKLYTPRALLDELVVGREPRCALTLRDSAVSARHCRVFWGATGNRIWVEDLESQGGTWLDGRRVTRRAVLKEGAVLRVGATSLRISRSSAAGVAHAA